MKPSRGCWAWRPMWTTSRPTFLCMPHRDRRRRRAARRSVWPSTSLGIVLRSLHRYDEAVALRYHTYFLVPALARDRVDGVVAERLHTLAQLFVELREPRLSPHWMHLQIYTYNPTVRERLRAAVRAL